MERQQVTDLKLSYVHCIQLFSEVEIVYIHMHTKTNKHNVMWFRGSEKVKK